MKAPRKPLVVAFLAALGLVAWQTWPRPRDEAAATPAPARAAARGAAEAGLPRIGLDRLASPRPPAEPAGRDVFQFGRPSAPPVSASQAAAPPAFAAATPPPLVAAAPPGPPAPPPFAVRYVGTLESKGAKVAILMSDDKKEILTGREGEVVANRLRIVRIGLESVDVQDVGADRTRRIPLKGN
ncbi:MAG: hypothetical protein AB7O37_22665 [Vicinamibacteria bacterium]